MVGERARYDACMSSHTEIPEGFVAIADGRVYGPGSVVELSTELVDVTDEFGMFGPPQTAQRFARGLTDVRIDGEPVSGPVFIRHA